MQVSLPTKVGVPDEITVVLEGERTRYSTKSPAATSSAAAAPAAIQSFVRGTRGDGFTSASTDFADAAGVFAGRGFEDVLRRGRVTASPVILQLTARILRAAPSLHQTAGSIGHAAGQCVFAPAGVMAWPYWRSLWSLDNAFFSSSICPPTVKLAGFWRGGYVTKVFRNLPT